MQTEKIKPHIRLTKGRFFNYWECRYESGPYQLLAPCGFGDTPSKAYADFARNDEWVSTAWEEYCKQIAIEI